MKKLLILLLALVMCLSVLTSCDQVKGWIDGIIGGEEPPVTDTQADSAITLIKDDLKDWNITAADYQLNAFTHQGEVKVEWSVNVDAFYVRITHDYENGIVYVDVNEEATTDVAYVLTAKVTDSEGNVRETSFNLTLPKDRLTTYAEYAAAEAGTTVKVQGVVTGIIRKTDGWSSNSIYFQDADGGYYAYNVADADVANLAAGMTVKVVGKKDLYNGTYEIIECSVDVVDSTTTLATAADYTEIYKNAPALDDASLVGKQSFLVTLKGVEITTQNASNGYLNFTLNGVESYLRISSSNNCVSKDVTEAIKAAHADHFGWKADVTGLVSVYNGKFYLIPATGVDAFSNFVEVEKTPAQKVESEKTTLSIETGYSVDGEYTLPVAGTNYADVVITWASNNENVVVGANGVITVTVPDTKTEVVLTATLTCGEATATKEITITLNKTITSIADANAIGAAQGSDYTADKYLVAGVVTEITSDKYGNMYISDGTNKFYIYGLYDAENNRYDAMTVKPVVGDYVVVLTALGQYNGAPQGKNATLVTHVAPTTIVEANTIGAAQGSDYTAEKYIVTGVVDEIASDKYGNIYIKDADGTRFYIYGLYDQAGNRYDAMTVKPVVGDTITVLTALGQYKGAPQGKNATLVAHTASETTTPDHTHTPCDTCGKCTAEDCTGEKCEGHEAIVHPEGVVDPVVGTPYAFGMVQKNKDNTTYYLKGGMNGYYLETTDKHADALHVYIEETTGGYYLYCYVGETKTYINCVVSEDGQHVNGAYEATASTVYRYDATSKTLIAVVNDTDYWFGTRNDKTYTTVGPCAVSYAGFYCQFYNIDTTPHEHVYEDVTVAATCTAAGSVTPTCSCGEVDAENVKVLPAHTLDENNVCTKCGAHVLDASVLEVFPQDKENPKYPNGTALTHGIFDIYFGKSGSLNDGQTKDFKDAIVGVGTHRMNFGGSTPVLTAGKECAVIKFTTTSAAKVTIWWVAGGTDRHLTIVTADGTAVGTHEGDLVQNDPYITTFELAEAGEYYISSSAKSNYIFRVEVTPVKEVVAGEQTTVSTTVEAYATANSWADSTLYASVALDSNITITTSGTPVGTYALNTGKYYTSNQSWRIYQNENPSVTITAAEGKTIVSVKITYAVKNSGTLTLNGENVASDTVVTVNGSSVTFSVGNTGTKTNGQAQITAIEVIYE